jgi:hypothetical protein
MCQQASLVVALTVSLVLLAGPPQVHGQELLVSKSDEDICLDGSPTLNLVDE